MRKKRTPSFLPPLRTLFFLPEKRGGNALFKGLPTSSPAANGRGRKMQESASKKNKATLGWLARKLFFRLSLPGFQPSYFPSTFAGKPRIYSGFEKIMR